MPRLLIAAVAVLLLPPTGTIAAPRRSDAVRIDSDWRAVRPSGPAQDCVPAE